MTRPSRRLLLLAAASAAAGLHAQPSSARDALPRRRDLLLRGGHVVTMDSGAGDLPTGDVHIRDGAIHAVGRNLRAPGAEVVDARGMIVMPGFVDTHWHMWNSFLRGIIRSDEPRTGYFPTTLRVAKLCTPQDAYRSVRLSAAEGLLSGVTTVHDWSHNTRTPAHADAEIEGLLGMGIRARFSRGVARESDAPPDVADLRRIAERWMSDRGNGLSLGAVLTPKLADGRLTARSIADIAAVKALGLPMTAHCDGGNGMVTALARDGGLGPDWLLVHAQGLTPEEQRLVTSSGAAFSTSPVIEINYSTIRNGHIQFDELEQVGARMSLSFDSTAASANADFFQVMRALLWSHRQRRDRKIDLQPRRVVELATIDGARALGLEAQTGSLTPGKRADVILVRTTDLNMSPFVDPYHALVYSAAPGNVDTVIADGRVLVRRGLPAAFDPRTIVREASASLDRLRAEDR